MAESPQVLHFDPLQPVYLLDLNGDAITDSPLRKQGDLHDGIGLGIRSPWKEDRCLPGIARGDGGVQYLVDLGKSLASIIFDEKHGWGCNALVPKEQVMSGLAKGMVETVKARPRSFTERLVKRAAKDSVKRAAKRNVKT